MTDTLRRRVCAAASEPAWSITGALIPSRTIPLRSICSGFPSSITISLPEPANYATAFSPATIAAQCIRLPAMGDHRRGHIATDRSWTGIRLQQKRADVLPFSHARSIMEIYDLDAGYFDWRTSPLGGRGESPWFPVEEVADDRQLLERAVELADVSLVGGARLLTLANTVGGALGRSGKQIPEDPVAECGNDREIPFRGTARPSAGGNGGFVELHVETSEDSTALTYDFGELSSSFVGVEVSLPAGGAVDLVHADRIGDDGTIDPHGCASRCVVRLYCPHGRTRLESFEPYCVRYLRVIVRRARAFTLHDVFLRRYQYPDLQGGTFLCSDGKLNRIYEAARLTLRANTVDVFLDTPGRERGGWLCDSFWTARAARLMFGDTRVERAMLENFLAPTVARHFDGYSPAVYPAGKGSHLPNWTMFLILQLHEFYRRTGDRGFIDRYATRVAEIAAQLARHEDAEGVLNRLPGRIFVDGSTAPLPEYFHQPISMPTNLHVQVEARSVDHLPLAGDRSANRVVARLEPREIAARARPDHEALVAGIVRVGIDTRELPPYPLAYRAESEVVQRVHDGMLVAAPAPAARDVGIPPFPDRRCILVDHVPPRGHGTEAGDSHGTHPIRLTIYFGVVTI